MLTRRLLLGTALAVPAVVARAQSWRDRHPELVYAIIPAENATGMIERWTPFVQYMAKELGTKVTLRIANDYAATELFARQVRAHGRPGDVFLALSTSGRSANLLAAVGAATEAGLRTWALTGTAPNPLADIVDEAVVLPAPSTAVVQEVHQVAIHLLCEAVDSEVTA